MEIRRLIHRNSCIWVILWQTEFLCRNSDVFLCMSLPWPIHMKSSVTTHSYVWHDSFICVTWLIHACDMTHSYVCHDSSYVFVWHAGGMSHINDYTYVYIKKKCIYVYIYIYIYIHTNMTREWVHTYEFICVTWLIQMCDMTHSCVWRDAFVCVSWLIHVWLCDMQGVCHALVSHTKLLPYSHVCHDSFICVPWLIHICDMTHSYVWHDSFMCVPWLIRNKCDMQRGCVNHVSHIKLCFWKYSV